MLWQILEDIRRATEDAFLKDPSYISTALSKINGEAVALHKAGNHVAALAAFAKLFERARAKNLMHGEMYICYR